MKRILLFMVMGMIVVSNELFAFSKSFKKASKALDNKILEAQQRGTQTPAPPTNHAPTITNLAPANNAINVATSGGTLSWQTGDIDGDPVTSDVWFGTATLSLIATNLSTSQFTLPVLVASTTYQWQVVASDSKGSITNGEIWKFTTVAIAPPPPPPNHAPVIESLIVTPSVIFRNKIATITCSASDPDGDSLEYQWSCDAGTLLIQGTPGPIIQWQAPSSEGTYTITCKVQDPYGATDSETIMIAVIVQTVFHLAGKAYGPVTGEIDFSGGGVTSGVTYNKETGLLEGYAWGPIIGTLSFNQEDLKDVPWPSPSYGTITYCKIRSDGKGIGWAKFITQPEVGHEKESLMGVSKDTFYSDWTWGIILDFQTGKFTGWSWDMRWSGSWINWDQYYGSQYGVFIKDWVP